MYLCSAIRVKHSTNEYRNKADKLFELISAADVKLTRLADSLDSFIYLRS